MGAPYESEMIYVSHEHLLETLAIIPYMRSRFTGIDVIYRLGMMDEFTQRVDRWK